MFITSLLVIGGLVLLTAGAEIMIRGSVALSLRLGLTVVAFGMGSPELFVSIEAAYGGNGGIALGNVVGSNISNIALILGLSALVRWKEKPALYSAAVPQPQF